ncbi:MAG: YihY family inner membrane protein [Alphaproteobacteria bacterium]
MTETVAFVPPPRPNLWALIRHVGVRFWIDHCFSTAASLAYTTLLAIVPMMAISFAILAAFPVFDSIRLQLQQFLFENFLPISADVMREKFDEFVKNVGSLTAVGVVFLAGAALIVLDTVETAFNAIWRQRRVRPIMQRLVIFWAILTMTPLLVGGSVALSGYIAVVSAKVGLEAFSGVGGFLLRLLPFVLVVAAATLAYIIIPFRKVRFTHGLIGGIVLGALIEALRNGFALYFSWFPSYQTIYGALAVIPLFLVWLYLVWAAILFGAQIAASIPEWRDSAALNAEGAVPRRLRLPFALQILETLLHRSKTGGSMDSEAIARAIGVERAFLSPLLEMLAQGGFVARLESNGWVLTRDLEVATLAELFDVLDLAVARRAAESIKGDPAWRTRLIGVLAEADVAEHSRLAVSIRALLEGETSPQNKTAGR